MRGSENKMSNLFPNYSRWDIELIEGKGTIVTDTFGKTYLDFTSGIGVVNLGHCHPEVVDQLTQQAHTLWHVSNLFQSSLQEEVAKKLSDHSMGNAVFFCNSGAEANEAAIKLARKYTGKTKIITFLKSFHGRTFGTMAATGQEKIKEGFGPMLETFIHLPFNDIEALKATIDENTAAVMLEVIQGEGGVYPATEEFLDEVQTLCKQYDALLIIDEVQTGIGRTGKPFAYQHYGISPDIITSAKGLGNGFPTGAIIAKEYLSSTFHPGSHGSTFGGNPLAMTAAKATLNIVFQEDFLQEVQEKGDYFVNQLKEWLSSCSDFIDLRYKGLMIGIEFKENVAPILAELRKNGLLLLSAGEKVIRILPPLTVTYSEIDKAVSIMKHVLLNPIKG